MSSVQNYTLDLSRLKRDVPALSEPVGGSLIEACMICLEDQDHKSGTQIEITGDFNTVFSIVWEGNVTPRMLRSWYFEDDATEDAAYGIAVLLMEALTGYTAIERAGKGSGVDFWLGVESDNPDAPFEYLALLEVSGIRRGSTAHIEARVRQKRQQVARTGSDVPVYIVIVEFSGPIARILKL